LNWRANQGIFLTHSGQVNEIGQKNVRVNENLKFNRLEAVFEPKGCPNVSLLSII
jgi:hypothetical protein